MKQLVILLLAITPLFLFSQGSAKNTINWISLKEAKALAEKHNQKMLIFFYKKDCPYCEKMKKETLNNPTVIDIINRNFFAVKMDSRTKDTIYYNNIAYSNQQPIEHGYTWRHDFYFEVAAFNRNGSTQITTPTIVLFNNKFEKIATMPGNHPKELLLRKLQHYIK